MFKQERNCSLPGYINVLSIAALLQFESFGDSGKVYDLSGDITIRRSGGRAGTRPCSGETLGVTQRMWVHAYRRAMTDVYRAMQHELQDPQYQGILTNWCSHARSQCAGFCRCLKYLCEHTLRSMSVLAESCTASPRQQKFLYSKTLQHATFIVSKVQHVLYPLLDTYYTSCIFLPVCSAGRERLNPPLRFMN